MLPIYNDNIQGKYSETLEAIGDLLIDLQDAAFNEGVKHANDWVSVEDELPPPGLTQYSCYGKDFRNTDIPFY